MPEQLNQKQVFSLLEVSTSIQKTLSQRYKSSFWVKAEMNKLNYYQHSGHCYPELVEKKEGKIITQIRAHIWKTDFIRINSIFQSVLKEPLKDGIKILFEAKIIYDTTYGLSLWITDIDPSFTLGDLEHEKQQTIKKLKEDGVFSKNKYQKLPLLPQRIAIISVETSKGYADFLKIIESNSWNYKFFCFMFPSLLQGDKAVQSIYNQLQRIKKVINHFDVVAIIRGGGGDVGLSCYNNYQLAKEIATFPLPILTGIGHATNETVCEMISYSNAITPTKLAEYLIQKFHNFSVPVKEAETKINDKAKRLLKEEKNRFQAETKLFRSVSKNIITTNHNEVKNLSKSLLQNAKFVLKNEYEDLQTIKKQIIKITNALYSNSKQKLRSFANIIIKDSFLQLNKFKLIIGDYRNKFEYQSKQKIKNSNNELQNIEKNISNMSPSNVLKRGYSITYYNGKTLTKTEQVKSGDTLKTALFEGEIISIVN